MYNEFKKKIMLLMLFIFTIAGVSPCFASGGGVAMLEYEFDVPFPGGNVEVYGKSAGIPFNNTYSELNVRRAESGITEFTGFFENYYGSVTESINRSAFSDCTQLKIVDLYGYDGRIERGTFANCTSLEKVAIYSTTARIDNEAFEGCDKDKLVIYCEKGSAAEAFAAQYGYKYRLMSVTPLNELEDKVFDAETYKRNNPDVVKALGTDENVLYNHWIEYGINEGRKGSNIFDVKYYIDRYPDIQEFYADTYMDAYKHFITMGYKNGRIAIEAPDYGDVNCDGKITVEDVNLLMTYILTPEKSEYEKCINDNFKYCDVNNDGVINTADTGMILQKVLDSSYMF